MGYVIEGSVSPKMKGQPEKINKVGESLYESTNGLEISANASHTEPANIIAQVVCDRDVPLSVPPSASEEGEQS